MSNILVFLLLLLGSIEAFNKFTVPKSDACPLIFVISDGAQGADDGISLYCDGIYRNPNEGDAGTKLVQQIRKRFTSCAEIVSVKVDVADPCVELVEKYMNIEQQRRKRLGVVLTSLGHTFKVRTTRSVTELLTAVSKIEVKAVLDKSTGKMVKEFHWKG